jgi:hypothetical protein
MDTVAIFCAIDDFCQWFEPWWEQRLLELAPKRRRRRGGLCLSEVMTILVGFHLSGYRTFKHYYLGEVLRHQRPYFPGIRGHRRNPGTPYLFLLSFRREIRGELELKIDMVSLDSP